MTIVLFDQPNLRTHLLPFTFTRPIAEIRVGILNISEKWSKYLKRDYCWLTEPYLREKYPFKADSEYVYINSASLPEPRLAESINQLKEEESLHRNGILLAARTNKKLNYNFTQDKNLNFNEVEYSEEVTFIDRTWKIFLHNGDQIRADLEFYQHLKGIELKDPFTRVYNPENVFIEEGAKVRAAILNAENGPIYIGRNAEIKEGAAVRGPLALCEGSIINMGAKIIGDNTIGPYSKVGGEMSNSVIFGYSNKSHDGFLGNSVIGEWCNIGADTNTSNLKNNYQKVKLWDYETEKFENTGLQFCGLIMGDHAKCGINTMFNTATIVGTGANVFGEGFPRNYIPAFSWGGSKGYSTFKFDKFLEMTETVLNRRNREFDETERKILEHVYQVSAKFRTWEK